MKKIVVGIIALLVIAGVVVGFKYKKTNETPLVRLVQISNENISENLKFEGVVEAEQTIGLYKKISMVVDEMLVNPGTYVKKGQELATFVGVGDGEINGFGNSETSIKIEQSQLEVDTLAKQLTELKRRKLVVKFQLDNANETADTMKKLLKEDGVSSIEANKYITAAALKDLEYNNVLKDISLTSTQLKIKSDILSKNIKEIKSKFVAPENGIITEVFVENGSVTTPNRPLVSFASLKKGLEVKVMIPIYQAQGITEGANVNVVSKGSMEENKYTGKIKEISQIATLVKSGSKEERFITATVVLDSSEGLLPGANVGVEISGKELNGIDVVDAFSVIEQNGKYYVYKVNNNRVEKVEVQIGIKTLSKYQILNLPVGTKLIVNPFKVKVGEEVRVRD